MGSVRLLAGDAAEVLVTLEPESVHSIVTSPPYFGLRNYLDHEGQIGLEESPDAYVDHLVAVFRAAKRVLRDDGTLWLNLGDSFASSTKGTGDTGDKSPKHHTASVQAQHFAPLRIRHGVKDKDLIGIPWMVAFALRADGWYLRSDIIWHKPNAMPESVRDRPTKAHEYLFLLTKRPSYYYDSEAIKEPAVKGNAGSTFTQGKTGVNGLGKVSQKERQESPLRNKRSVWSITTQPFSAKNLGITDIDHFAAFPPELVRPCVLAGTSEYGVCSVCLSPYRRIVESAPVGWNSGEIYERERNRGGHTDGFTKAPNGLLGTVSHTIGWAPTCSCDAGPIPATVLDPFCGSGTAGLVCQQEGRSFVGIDINAKYLQLAEARIRVA